MNCKSCGTSNPEGAIFCRKCGEKLKNDGNNGCLKTIAWLFAICVIGGIIALIYNNQSNYTPSNPSPSLPSPETPSNSPIKTTTYLNISDNDLYFYEDGGSEVVSISTDGEWEIFGDTIDWITLSKTSSSVTVRVESNKRSKRTGYFSIIANDFEERVMISQSANSGPYGEIEKLWVEYNEYNDDGRKGLKIHVEFTVHNMLNKDGKVNAYFYHEDGTPLKDTNGKYCTSDGCVAKSGPFTPPSVETSYNYELFMPYSELHLEEPTSFFFVVNIRYNGKRISDNSEKWHMEYTNN